MRPYATILCSVAALLCASCGYIGDPKPPALNIPRRATDLKVEQQGSKIIATYTPPELTTEGLTITAIDSAELRGGVNPGGEFDIARWAAAAQLAAGGEWPVDGWAGRDMIFGVRFRNKAGRYSEWSNLFVLPVRKPPATPSSLAAQSVAEGLKLQWTGDSEAYRLFRDDVDLGQAPAPTYLDSKVEPDKQYKYIVQGVSKDGSLRSDRSAPLEAAWRDMFPPSVPNGLVVIASTNSVELTWQRNTEDDFKSYRVYRAEGDRPLTEFAPAVEAPAFSDKSIQSGKRYRYSLSAVDTRGNESAKSQTMEVITQ